MGPFHSISFLECRCSKVTDFQLVPKILSIPLSMSLLCPQTLRCTAPRNPHAWNWPTHQPLPLGLETGIINVLDHCGRYVHLRCYLTRSHYALENMKEPPKGPYPENWALQHVTLHEKHEALVGRFAVRLMYSALLADQILKDPVFPFEDHDPPAEPLDLPPKLGAKNSRRI